MTEPEAKLAPPQIPDRILVAAAEVIGREGFVSASLRQIAEQAGMTKAGLYYHVPSKEVLLFALHERFSSKLRDHAERIVAAELSATEKLRELILATVRTAGEYKAEGTVFLREFGHLTGQMRSAITAERTRYREIFEQVIADGIAVGEFRAGSPQLDAMAILGACNFTAFWFHPEGALTIDEVAEAFADRLVNGLHNPNKENQG